MKNSISKTIGLLFLLASLSCEKPEEVYKTTEETTSNICTSCVHYAKKILGITGPTTLYAKDWGILYQIPNYNQVTNPNINDIIVIEPEVNEWSANAEFLVAGHVGFVRFYEFLNDGSLKLSVKGGNQSGDSTECECLKVSVRTFIVPQNKLNHIRFYRSNTPYYTCGDYNEQITLETPTLITPMNNSVNTNSPINFTWQSVNNATEYRIQVSTNPSGWTSQNGFSNGIVVDFNVNVNFYNWMNAQLNTNYYWSIKAISPSSSSNYSEIFHFNYLNNINSNPIINFSNTNINFSNTLVGQVSTQQIIISNSGNEPLSIYGITSNNPAFSCNYSGTIYNGNSISVQINFNPTNSQNYSGQLVINSNASPNTSIINLNGTGFLQTNENPCFIYTFPSIGLYSECSNLGDICDVRRNNIIARIVNINCQNHEITFEFKKCNGTGFSNNGTLGVVSGICAGASYGNYVQFQAGQMSKQITIIDNSMVGIKTYYLMIEQNAGNSVTPAIQVNY